ncbi:MAG: YggS family pyridoxal phosphate-dependent enzyme [Candidatus Omnitrophica bacterium]|nr:YggS family pyridoxal phosphate-dependent enzyme [Candidatus Omnitrophota bacterium]
MVKDNIFKIKERISTACAKSGYDPHKITIVAVTKGRSVDEIKEAIEAGATDIGENKVQEALLKYNELLVSGQGITPVKWHMVGHLQTNKVKDAVKIFDLIQSVDSLHLAQEIDKEARKINKVQEILVEIKTSPEENKTGLKAGGAIEDIMEIIKLDNISIKGLMTIAPIVDNPDEARPYFQKLKELKDEINIFLTPAFRLQILSMGMTDDFEVAVREGSNMVRLGRAIFEG